MDKRLIGIICAVLCALLWGVLAIGLKVALKEVDVYSIIWWRFTMSFLILFFYYLISDRQSFNIFYKMPYKLPLGAIFLGINYLGFMIGLKNTSPINAQILIQLGPLLLAVYGIIGLKEKINFRQGLGFLVTAIGFYLFYSQQLKAFSGSETTYNSGLIWILIAAVAWAVFSIFQKQMVVSWKPQQLNMIIYLIPVIMFAPLADFHVFTKLSLSYWLLMIFLGANTVLSYGFLAQALQYLEANKVSIIIIMNPIITFILMGLITIMDVSWIDGEKFNLLTVIGAITGLSGAVMAVAFRKPIEIISKLYKAKIENT